MKHIKIIQTVIIVLCFALLLFQENSHSSQIVGYKQKIDSLTITVDSLDTELLIQTINNGRYEYMISKLDSDEIAKISKLVE